MRQSSTFVDPDVSDRWHRLLQEVVLAENYNFVSVIQGGSAARNPVLDKLLPALLYVNMVSLLDEALQAVIAAKSLVMSRRSKGQQARYAQNLYGRIEFLNDQALLANRAGLHEVRERRNNLSHESTGTTSWGQLQSDLCLVDVELQHLNCVGERPDYRFYMERNVDLNHGEPGVCMIRRYQYGVKDRDEQRMWVSYSEKVYRFGWDEQKVQEALARNEQPPTGAGD